MRHHHDQAVIGHPLEDVHDLDTDLAVKGAGRLVGEHNVRVVHEGAGNRHALHLATRELARPLVDVLRKPHLREGLDGTTASLSAPHTRERERKLHVGEYRLVWYEVVALEDKAHTVVAVVIPIPRTIALGRDTVDDDVARVSPVKATKDVEQRGLARARGTKHGHELIVTQTDRNRIECDLGEGASPVRLRDIPELKHARLPCRRTFAAPDPEGPWSH